MADNITLDPGALGATLAADDIAGVHHQRVKVQHGADGAATDVSAASPMPIDDAGGSLTVDGTVTVTHPALGGGVEAGAQRVTVATDSTGVLSVDDNGATLSVDDGAGSLTIDNADITTIAGAVAGTEMQVDVVASLPAGTNAIGKLAANDGVDIGDVDVTSVVPGTAATNLGKAIDTAVGATDTGVAILMERDDVLAAVTPVEGDWLGLRGDARGALWVNANDDVVSTNNSTTSTLTSASTFTGAGDNCLGFTTVTVHIEASHDSATDGMSFEFSSDNTNWDDMTAFTYTAADGARRFQFPATAQYFRFVYTNGGTGQTHFRVQTVLKRQNMLTSVHRLVDNTSPDRSAQVVKSALIAQAAGSGDFIPVQSTAGGNLKVSLEEVNGLAGGGTEAVALRVTIATDSTGLLSVDDNGGSLTVDGTVTVTHPAIGGGTETGAQRVTIATDSTGVLSVDDNGSTLSVDDGGGTLTVDNGGTFAVQQDKVDRTTDNVGVAEDASSLMDDTTVLTVKRANIAVDGSGNQALIAAVAAKTLRIVSIAIFTDAAVDAYFNDGTADIFGDATHLVKLDNTGAVGVMGFVLGHNPQGWFETAAVNRPVNINLSAVSKNIAGTISYVEV